MADVSKISANSVEYTIKDATARSSISSIQSDINTINGDITAIEGDVSTLQGQMTTAQGNISTLQNTATGLQNQINLLQTESANGYCKLPDGTMIQWGTVTVSSPTITQIASSGVYYSTISLTFPIAFVSKNYCVSGNSKFSTGHQVPFGAIADTAAKAIVHIYDFYERSGNVVLSYTAVGRWK